MADSALTDAHYDWVRHVTGIDIGSQRGSDADQPVPPSDPEAGAPASATSQPATAEQSSSSTAPSPTSQSLGAVADQPDQSPDPAADEPDQPADAEADDEADDAATAKQVTDATDKVTKLSDDDLKKLPAADKVKMLKDLQAGGKPSGDARKAQMKILRDMQLDPDFKKREDERGDRIAKALKGDKELKAARDNWAKLSDDDKIKALKKIVATQSKEYGIPPPAIEKEFKESYIGPDGKKRIENGRFNPDDGKLHLNTNKRSKMGNFGGAIDLVIHENGHNYQRKLIKDLKDGKIKPGDPDYTQATIFAANDGAGGYVQPKEDPDTYVKQPKENHSRTIAPATSKKIVDSL